MNDGRPYDNSRSKEKGYSIIHDDNDDGMDGVKCYECGEYGHYAWQKDKCPNAKQAGSMQGALSFGGTDDGYVCCTTLWLTLAQLTMLYIVEATQQ